MKRKTHKFGIPKREKKPVLTKKEFHQILDGASQPIKKPKSDQEKS